MIRAHMATYPARGTAYLQAVEAIAPQVDHLALILNEYDVAPVELARFENVEPIVPADDLKDTGKFWPDVDKDDDVFLVDDDIVYAPDYVSHTLDSVDTLDTDAAVFGYHGSFMKAGFRRNGYVRRIFHFKRGLDRAVFVDQIGTGTVYLKGRHMPKFDDMKTSQRFVDIRFAKWCHEQAIDKVCLPRRKGLLVEMHTDTTIWDDFTQSLPDAVMDEVKAYGRKQPGFGQNVPLKPEFAPVGADE